MALDKAAVTQIARLARIRVSEEDLAPLAAELSRILDWVEALNAVDTEGVPPLASVADLCLPMRADAVTDGGCAQAILGNAPLSVDGFFAVPKVVE